LRKVLVGEETEFNPGVECVEVDMIGMKLHQEQNGHYSDATRIEKS
jgi:hypothetical protein